MVRLDRAGREGVYWGEGGPLLCPGPSWASLCIILEAYLPDQKLEDPRGTESPRGSVPGCVEESPGLMQGETGLSRLLMGRWGAGQAE